MYILGKKQRSQIFTRLVSIFLLVMALVYGMGIYIYSWGLRTVKNEIRNSTKAQSSFYLERLEEEMERIKILQYDCLNDEALQKLAIRRSIMNDYEAVNSILQLHQRLGTIKNSSTYIRDVSAHIPPIDKTISANAAVNPVQTEKFQEIRVPYGEYGAQFIKYKDGLYLTTLHQELFSARNPLYSIEVELNEQAFNEAIKQFNTYPGSGSFLISLSTNVVLENQTENHAYVPEDFLPDYFHTQVSGSGYNMIDDKEYYYVYVKSEYLNMILLRYIPQELVLTPIQNFYIWVWIFSAAAVMIIISFSLATYQLIHKPLLALVKAFQKVEKGDLQVTIDIDSNNEFGYLYKRFNAMVVNLNTLIDQAYKQKILMQRAELKQLQSQINPHFLYNSFFMIHTMARVGDDNLIPFTKHLGEYFRFITRNDADYVPLSEEVGHARTYTEIQLMRFSKRLEIQFGDCPEKFSRMEVPRLILQPVIENAFEHAVERKKSNGIIAVNFFVNEDNLSISVEDNGSDFSEEQVEALQKRLQNDCDDANVTGLINIHRRIRLVYGEGCGLHMERSQLGGLKVVMILKPSEGEKAGK